MTLAISLLAIFLLILLSAFFNASETALTAASRARMHALQEDGNVAAKLVNVVLSRPEKMIGTVLLGNTLVDVLAAALASNIAVEALRRGRRRLCDGCDHPADRDFRCRAAEDLCARLCRSRGACRGADHAWPHLHPDALHEGHRIHCPPDAEVDARQSRRRGQYSRGA